MASNSKQSKPNETKFTEAEKNWHLDKLYEDLRAVKQGGGSVKRKILTETEKCHLRGLLCGKSPEEIANERGVVVGTVNDALSKTLYGYIKELLNNNEVIRHWSDIPNLLEKAGYKIQASDQSQFSHPLPGKAEKTLEAPNKIEAISFLEYFSKSIDQLKSKELDVRIGAISTLGTLAKYSQTAEHWTIMEYLAAFVRNAPGRKEEEGIPDDIQAALTVIGRRDPKKDKGLIDLRNIDIRGANLQRANLPRVKLDAANLKRVNFQEADLRGAFLDRANLKGAFLARVKLQSVTLTGANLQETVLFEANLQMANLIAVDLQGSLLRDINLEGALLRKANLQGVFLRAKLKGADLTGANLRGADLSEAENLDSRQIQEAFGDSTTVLPESVARRSCWM